ncbi:hypothetical protein SNEBB_010502 [Seison nebaliae]|nr:hypothetical protein SNEBB_010502 [Seison nebaliae]
MNQNKNNLAPLQDNIENLKHHFNISEATITQESNDHENTYYIPVLILTDKSAEDIEKNYPIIIDRQQTKEARSIFDVNDINELCENNIPTDNRELQVKTAKRSRRPNLPKFATIDDYDKSMMIESDREKILQYLVDGTTLFNEIRCPECRREKIEELFIHGKHRSSLSQQQQQQFMSTLRKSKQTKSSIFPSSSSSSSSTSSSQYSSCSTESTDSSENIRSRRTQSDYFHSIDPNLSSHNLSNKQFRNFKNPNSRISFWKTLRKSISSYSANESNMNMNSARQIASMTEDDHGDASTRHKEVEIVYKMNKSRSFDYIADKVKMTLNKHFHTNLQPSPNNNIYYTKLNDIPE